jgi:hypothetical protein
MDTRVRQSGSRARQVKALSSTRVDGPQLSTRASDNAAGVTSVANDVTSSTAASGRRGVRRASGCPVRASQAPRVAASDCLVAWRAPP